VLNNNYAPVDRFTVISTPSASAPTGATGRKLFAGTEVWLPVAEAQTLTGDGRASYTGKRL